MRVRFVVQARLRSSRLPRKVLKPIGNDTLVQHINRRVADEVGQDNIVFALAREQDQSLVNYMTDNRLPFQIGDMSNVLSRFVEIASDLEEADYVVRLTADNPFVEMAAWPKLRELLKTEEPDLAFLLGVPLGMGYEAVRVAALRSQLKQRLQPHHFEHVTTYIKENENKYSIASISPLPTDITARVRLTIDTELDLAMARKTHDYFVITEKSQFMAHDVWQLLDEHDDFFSTNRDVPQRPSDSYESG